MELEEIEPTKELNYSKLVFREQDEPSSANEYYEYPAQVEFAGSYWKRNEPDPPQCCECGGKLARFYTDETWVGSADVYCTQCLLVVYSYTNNDYYTRDRDE